MMKRKRNVLGCLGSGVSVRFWLWKCEKAKVQIKRKLVWENSFEIDAVSLSSVWRCMNLFYCVLFNIVGLALLLIDQNWFIQIIQGDHGSTCFHLRCYKIIEKQFDFSGQESCLYKVEHLQWVHPVFLIRARLQKHQTWTVWLGLRILLMLEGTCGVVLCRRYWDRPGPT